MADARASMAGTQATGNSPNPQVEPVIPDSFLDTPPDFHPDPGGPSQPSSLLYRTDTELRFLLQALPTKADIVAFIGTVETAHRKELKEVKSELKGLSSRLAKCETSLSTLDHRVTALEELQETHVEALIDQQLHL